MVNRIIADIHTHTLVSGHAYGTIREMAQAAAEKKIEMIGFTEHAPGIPGTVDPFYFYNLKAIPRKLYGVNIIHGSEINVLNDGTLSLEDKYFGNLDYGIVGIHKDCYKDAGKKQNTYNLIQCMKHQKVKFVSHPDDDNTPLDYEKLVEAAKKYNVALELNNSSLIKKEHRLNCYENYTEMLALCMDNKVNIIVSSDAHDPSQVGEFTLAEEFLDKIGFDEKLILNTDIQKVMDFIND